MQNEILTVKDLNRYLPAIKTNEDMVFTDKISEGLFLADPIDGLAKIPDESIDLIVTEPSLHPKNNSLSGDNPTFENYKDWVNGWLNESKRVLSANGSIYIICICFTMVSLQRLRDLYEYDWVDNNKLN